MKFKIKFAESKKDFFNAKQLFKEYSDSLDFSLSFQNIDEELENIKNLKGKEFEGINLLFFKKSYL